MKMLFLWFMAALVAGGIGSSTRADEPATPAPAAQDGQAAPAAERIAGWVKDLANDDFETRIQAAENLQEAGQAAIAPVAEAALGGDLDVATRCIAILESLHRAEDAATKQAAKAALEKLAKSDDKSVAQRADAIVNPPPAPQNGINLGNGGVIRLQINGRAIAGPGMRMQVRVVNGKREVEVEENGRKVRISDESGKNIVVRTEEPDANGKTQTKEVKADDLDDLKKKDPEAAKLYEKYTSNNGPVRIFGGAGGIQIRPLPAIVPQPELPPEKILPVDPAPQAERE
ncbi:MAG: hypothetical protein WD069_04445 [Planctomycetales bacterium]